MLYHQYRHIRAADWHSPTGSAMMTLALTPRQWPKLCAGRKQGSDVVRLQQCGISVAIQDPFGHGLKLWGLYGFLSSCDPSLNHLDPHFRQLDRQYGLSDVDLVISLPSRQSMQCQRHILRAARTGTLRQSAEHLQTTVNS